MENLEEQIALLQEKYKGLIFALIRKRGISAKDKGANRCLKGALEEHLKELFLKSKCQTLAAFTEQKGPTHIEKSLKGKLSDILTDGPGKVKNELLVSYYHQEVARQKSPLTEEVDEVDEYEASRKRVKEFLPKLKPSDQRNFQELLKDKLNQDPEKEVLNKFQRSGKKRRLVANSEEIYREFFKKKK